MEGLSGNGKESMTKKRFCQVEAEISSHGGKICICLMKLLMAYVEGLSFVAVARILGIPLGLV
jgi:hypothetical protein